MNSNTDTNNGHLLLFRGTNWHRDLAPEEIQRIMGDWTAWFEGLHQKGMIIAASPLEREGHIVTGDAHTDGPFTESKESIGGFFMLKTESMDEALVIARMCPALPYGLKVEVRPVAPACPAAKMVEEAKAHALA
jgi:hypothetical protein